MSAYDVIKNLIAARNAQANALIVAATTGICPEKWSTTDMADKCLRCGQVLRPSPCSKFRSSLICDNLDCELWARPQGSIEVNNLKHFLPNKDIIAGVSGFGGKIGSHPGAYLGRGER